MTQSIQTQNNFIFQKGIAIISLFGLIAIASATPAILQTAATQRADELLPFKFEDVIPSRFSLRGFNGTWVTGKMLFYLIWLLYLLNGCYTC